jgi:quinol monooxygenase YgiN
MSKLAVFAKLTALPGMRDEVVEILKELVAGVATEEGTEVYAMHVDQADDVTVHFYELYTSTDALAVHQGSDVMKAVGPKLGGKLAGRPELTMTTLVVGKGL